MQSRETIQVAFAIGVLLLLTDAFFGLVLSRPFINIRSVEISETQAFLDGLTSLVLAIALAVAAWMYAKKQKP